MPDKMRIDKWLWTVRIYKSRTLASEACKKGRVRIGDIELKASSLIEAGQRIQIKKDKINLDFEILKIIPNRVSATLAAQCYINHTPEKELNKLKEIHSSAFYNSNTYVVDSRPTKKDRRAIDDFFNELN